MMTVRFFLLVGVVFAIAASEVRAQQPPGTRVVTIVNADSVAGDVVDGERLRRLFGNVHLRQDDTDLRARRATQYIDRELIIFEGDVRITDATDTLRADRVSYDARTRVGQARGRVRLSDAEAVLDSDSLVFYRAEKRAVFQAPVRLLEREGGGTLTSRRGTYFTGRKEAFFHDDVRLQDSTTVLTSRSGRYGTEDKRADFTGDVFLEHQHSTRMRADTLRHQRDTRVSEAFGNVAILRYGGREEDRAEPDTSQRTLLFGGYAFHDENARFSRIERGSLRYDPVSARLQTDSLGVTDTLLVRAHWFEAMQPEPGETEVFVPEATHTRVIGRGNVQLASDRLAATADSVVVDRLEFDEATARPPLDDIRLYETPFAWLNNRGSNVFTQISGDTLRVSARAEAIDSLWAVGRAFGVRPDTVIDRTNQMRGRRMLAVFEDDALRHVHVWPNAEVIFYRASREGELEGALRVTGDSLVFDFEGDDIRRMKFDRDVDGTFYDAALIPSPFRLEGPDYAPQNRPTMRMLLAGRPPLSDPFDGAPPLVPDEPEPAPEPDIPPELTDRTDLHPAAPEASSADDRDPDIHPQEP